MAFSFYGSLDQQWIDRKIEEYGINQYDIIDQVEEFGYVAKSILSSPNPVIFALLDCVSRQLFEQPEIQELSDGMREKFFSGVYESYYINCLDSHISPYDVVMNLKDEILEDYRENFLNVSENEIQEKFSNLCELCEKYSF